jgi:hypothetical protein
MPFTISHAAAVLPLKKSPLPLAALMIGSMSPDFSYFFPFGLANTSWHNLRGILLFCLPAGLASWLFYVRVLERPTIDLLPEAWRVRVIRSDSRLSIRALILAAIAVIVGAATHVVWDSFTHANTTVTAAFPALRTEVFSFHVRPVRIYFVLQCLSSVIGLLALAFWAFNLRRGEPRAGSLREARKPLSDRARVAALGILSMTSAFMALLSYASCSGARFEYRVFQLLIGGMMGWLLAWCVVAVWINRSARLAPHP